MKKVLFPAFGFLFFLFFTLLPSACALRSIPRVADPQETAVLEPKTPVDPTLPAENDATEPKGIYHRLGPGETLYSLSRAYQVPLDGLMRANRISDPARIQAGTRIFIPGSSGRAGPQPMAVTPLSWPLRGRITTKFGPRGRGREHEGIDIDGDYRDTVKAAAGGTVVQAWRRGDYGIMVVVDHGNGLTTLYAHLSKLLVVAGDRIERGDSIAKVGRSGKATGTHLHFEVRRNGQPVDPIPYLQSGTAVSARPH